MLLGTFPVQSVGKKIIFNSSFEHIFWLVMPSFLLPHILQHFLHYILVASSVYTFTSGRELDTANEMCVSAFLQKYSNSYLPDIIYGHYHTILHFPSPNWQQKNTSGSRFNYIFGLFIPCLLLERWFLDIYLEGLGHFFVEWSHYNVTSSCENAKHGCHLRWKIHHNKIGKFNKFHIFGLRGISYPLNGFNWRIVVSIFHMDTLIVFRLYVGLKFLVPLTVMVTKKWENFKFCIFGLRGIATWKKVSIDRTFDAHMCPNFGQIH